MRIPFRAPWYNRPVILVTGGTGFIGRALVRHLTEQGLPVRVLLRPAVHTPNLPRGMSIEVSVANLNNPRGLRAALVGVDTIYHLASAEGAGPRGSLLEVDIRGTQALVEAASDSGVKRLFYLSHLDADRASAYPLQKAKAIAEEAIRRSGIGYTILRSAIVFGPNDRFSTVLTQVLRQQPFFFFIPGDGRVQLQPLWVEDLVTCLTWAREDTDTLNRTIEVGGAEYLSFQEIIEILMQTTGIQRRIVNLAPPYLRGISVTLETVLPGLRLNAYLLDYLAVNRTTALDTLPRVFNLIPSRFSQRLDYLHPAARQPFNWRHLLHRQE